MEKIYEELTEKRKKYIETARENEFYEGIKDLLTKIYPDNAHFVYELLQNAEDTNATQVSFILKNNGLAFIHNGTRKFEYEDINAITSIANGTSKDDINKIGKFGVGFKSVFAYTDRPQIFSDDMSFAIEDLVLPIWDISEKDFRNIFGEDKKENKTYMYFPFKNEQLKCNNGYNQIRSRLENIEHTTLLFIKNIKEIQFKIEDNEQSKKNEFILERVEKNHNEIQIADTENTPSSWLRFRQFFTIDENENIIKTDDTTSNLFVSLAFLIKDEKLIPVEPNDNGYGQVSIYFPADKETSGLRFHIHAPFSSTVARSDINDQPINKKLISLLAELFANSILEVKSLGLLTNEIFEILPLRDELPKFYYEIYEQIRKIYEDEALLIIDNVNHSQEIKYANASDCYKVMNKSIKDVFTVGMLNHIYDEKRDFNIINPLNNSRMDKFINNLNQLVEVDQVGLVEKLSKKLELIKNESDKFVVFLETLDNNKIKSIFNFMHNYRSRELMTRQEFNNFKKLIRFKKNGIEKFNIESDECYFYIANNNTYNKYKVVIPEIYEGSEDAKSFLREIGVKELDKIQELRLETTNIERHIIIWNELLDKYNTANDVAELFGNDYPFVYSADNRRVKVCNILMFNVIPINGYSLINDLYKEHIKDYDFFIRVVEKLGAKSTIPIIKQDVQNAGYPEVKRLYDYIERIRRNDEKNEDYTLGGLKKAEHISDVFKLYNQIDRYIKISKLIISTIAVTDEEYQKAYYRPNTQKQIHSGNSSLTISLKHARWLINDCGELVKPSDINLETIHPLIKEDISKLNESWLKAINFNNIDANQSEQDHLSDEEYAVDMMKSGKITREDLANLAQQKSEEDIQKNEKREYKVVDLWSAFGSHDREIEVEEGIEFNHNMMIIHDPEKYMERHINDINECLDILKTSKREQRTINISAPHGKDKVKSFLYENYNGHCQICGFTFIKKDKKYHFNKFDWGSNKITNQDNTLAMVSHSLCLCGKCHSILKHGRFKPIFKEKLRLDVQELVKGNGNIDYMISNYQVINPCIEYFDETYGLEIELLDENQIIHYTQEHFISLITLLKDSL